MKQKINIDEIAEHLHYLKVLRDCGAVYQAEIRNAIDYAIARLEEMKL